MIILLGVSISLPLHVPAVKKVSAFPSHPTTALFKCTEDELMEVGAAAAVTDDWLDGIQKY